MQRKFPILPPRGAELVVLPERAININKETGDSIISILSNVQSKTMFSSLQDIQISGMSLNETQR